MLLSITFRLSDARLLHFSLSTKSSKFLSTFAGILTAMSSVTSGGDNRKISKGRRSSSLEEEAGVGGNIRGESPLKKGPWTAAEDAILVEYAKKHGQGNWNAVHKYSGLARCGKSCRLRWANHLRPDLKKGAFTAEEENRILELHAKMGNKWARMAAEVCRIVTSFNVLPLYIMLMLLAKLFNKLIHIVTCLISLVDDMESTHTLKMNFWHGQCYINRI